MLPIPGRIAAKWFGSAELSTATSVGVFGTQLGVSLSFLFPPMLVKNHESIEDIGSDLSFLSLSIAIATTANLLLLGLRKSTDVFIFFCFFYSPLPYTTYRVYCVIGYTVILFFYAVEYFNQIALVDQISFNCLVDSSNYIEFLYIGSSSDRVLIIEKKEAFIAHCTVSRP